MRRMGSEGSPPVRVTAADAQRTGGLTFDDFRALARDPDLDEQERNGFARGLREGAERAILDDVESKLPALAREGAHVVDIGCGSGPLVRELIARAGQRGQDLVLVDSSEMLAYLPDAPGVVKVAGRFPLEELTPRRGRADAVLAYSVLQYAYADASPFDFVDAALELLAPGGRLLIGDIPNASMRSRFLASDAGADFHRAYTGADDPPDPGYGTLRRGEPGDGLVLGLLAHARGAGFHAWVLPQPPELPLANRREDVVLARP
jgi:SAM-dependent methyltransferase